MFTAKITFEGKEYPAEDFIKAYTAASKDPELQFEIEKLQNKFILKYLKSENISENKEIKTEKVKRGRKPKKEIIPEEIPEEKENTSENTISEKEIKTENKPVAKEIKNATPEDEEALPF